MIFEEFNKMFAYFFGEKNNESAEGENSSNENKSFKFANQHELSKCVIFCVTFGEIIAINLIFM